MATAEMTIRRRRRPSDVTLALRQFHYEQLAFWRNPVSAVFTLGFSIVFLLLLAASGGTSRSHLIDNLPMIQYYVPGFAAYGVMSASFNNLAIALVTRRENGLLKRLRLSPLPTWVLFGGIFLSTLAICALQIVILLLLGRYGFHVALPHNVAALAVTLVVGVVCFTALGFGASSLAPNAEAAAPLVSITFFVLLFLAGLWFPLSPTSGLARISAYFPVRPFILAVLAPFEFEAHTSPWAWGDLGTVALWGAAGAAVALRSFSFEPRRQR